MTHSRSSLVTTFSPRSSGYSFPTSFMDFVRVCWKYEIWDCKIHFLFFSLKKWVHCTQILTTYPRFSKKGITSVLQDTKPTVHFPALLRPSTVSISLVPKPCLWNSGWTAMGPISIIPLWATALMHPRIYKKPKSSWVGIHKKRKPQCGASDVTWNWNCHFLAYS